MGYLDHGCKYRYYHSLEERASNLHVEFDREEDGRWIADVPQLPGVLAYDASREEARASAEAIAPRVVADQIENSKGAVAAVTFA